MIKVVAVRYRTGCKLYYFAPNENETYEPGMGVIVDTVKGPEFALVVHPVKEVTDDEVILPLRPILRIATKKELENIERGMERRPEAIRICKEKVEKHGLPMKIIDCEFSFDNSKVVFSFTAESRVDFRELVKDLASVFHLRIELRQVGIRDETKILGGIAPCGRVCCCASCMPDFKKVTIKMAKTQGISINPSKISGLCGRLMCCLSYENAYYADVFKKMPKIGSEVDTPEGKGTVVTTNMLKMEVRVKIEMKDGMYYKDFPVDKIRFKKGGKPEKEEEEEKSLRELED
ncbi:MAG: stage 0 sporulation family protein [Christensenellaceae bacterium]